MATTKASSSRTWITGLFFSLHYNYTVLLLVVCSGLIVLEVTWADGPIACGSTQPIDERFINSCWRFGLWSEPNADPKMSNTKMDFSKLTKLPTTYHYTFLLLLVQAIFFYGPFYFWSRYDNGSLKNLVTAMTGTGPETDDYGEPIPRSANTGLAFLKALNQRGGYFWRYVFFQFLNHLNVIIQFAFISYVFQVNFVTYGFKYLTNWGGEAATNADFPIFAYCKTPSFGPHDNKTTNYGLCILGVNSINEKVYFLIWAWLAFVGFASTLELIGRLTQASGCGAKDAHALFFKFFYVLRYFKCITVDMKYLVAHCDVSDWFVLSRIADNIIFESEFRLMLTSINDALQMRDLHEETPLDNKRARVAAEHDGASTATATSVALYDECDRPEKGKTKENEYVPVRRVRSEEE